MMLLDQSSLTNSKCTHPHIYNPRQHEKDFIRKDPACLESLRIGSNGE